MPAVTRLDPKDIFTPKEWAPIAKRSSWRGLMLVAGAWGLIFAAGAMFVIWPNPLTYVIAVMLIGARQLGLAILMHDAAHGALHSNMAVNNWVGEWLCAAPVGARLGSYRDYHLKHHRFTEQPEDPDLALSAPFPISRKSLWRKVVRDLTGQTFIKQRGAQLFGGRKAGEVVNASTGHFLLTNAILFGALALAGYWWAYPALWIVPMATWLPLVTRLRNIAEHACVGAQEHPLTHARTTLANPLERLFIAPYWVHYHAEHHAFMHVPCYRLTRLHQALMDKGYWSKVKFAPSYAAVLISDIPAFIRENTRVLAPSHIPELSLYLADDAVALWQLTEEQLGELGLPPPFWAFAWAGGQALARYVLDHREIVEGKHVLDVASGSGLVAIAAMKAGAASALAVDIDAFAAHAATLNAELNAVVVATSDIDPVGKPTDADIILVGDLFYDRDLAPRVLDWLIAQQNAGKAVLIGDPGRTYLPRDKLEQIAAYDIPVTRALEDAEIKRAAVWRLR